MTTYFVDFKTTISSELKTKEKLREVGGNSPKLEMLMRVYLVIIAAVEESPIVAEGQRVDVLYNPQKLLSACSQAA